MLDDTKQIAEQILRMERNPDSAYLVLACAYLALLDEMATARKFSTLRDKSRAEAELVRLRAAGNQLADADSPDEWEAAVAAWRAVATHDQQDTNERGYRSELPEVVKTSDEFHQRLENAE